MNERHLIIGTAGHVDHGKTALIKALTNIDCDTHKEEKERGITINLGFSHLDMPSGDSVGIVDVPGHKDFIRTMVAGAYGIDLVLLVIAADSGVMPQTTEHLNIIKMLGIKHGIVALTKSDLVDDEMIELAKMEISDLLKDTSLDGAPVAAVSSVTGNGCSELIEIIQQEIQKIPVKPVADDFRMTIDRIFNVKGFGIVVTGSVLSGMITSGKEIFLLPGLKKKIKIRNIERHRESVDNVFDGDRAALNLSGLKTEDFDRGMILSDKQIEDTSMVDAVVNLFTTETQLGLWSNVLFLTGTFECQARIHLLDKDSLKKDESAIVQIHLEKAYPFLYKDRFIIRNTSNDTTLGGGLIIDPQPLHHKKRSPQLIMQLKELADATLHSDRLYDLIKIELSKKRIPVLASDLAKDMKKPEAEIWDECVNSVRNDILLFDTPEGRVFIIQSADKQYRESIIQSIREYHKKNPLLEEGLETRALTGKPGFSAGIAGRQYLDALLEQLRINETIARKNNTWVSPEHTVKIDTKTREKLDLIDEIMLDQGMQIPVIKEIEELVVNRGIPKDKLKMMLHYLVNQQKLILYEGEFIHPSILDKARKILLGELIGNERGINEKDFRMLINGTKKFIQVLIAIFTKERIVARRSFYIDITEKGKEYYKNINT